MMLLNSQDQLWLENAITRICEKVEWVSSKSQNKIPASTRDGVHDNRRLNISGMPDDGLNWWTNGFFAGMMWQMFQETGNYKYADIGSNTEVWLDQCFSDFYGLHHDVGFMWLPSAVAHYRLTGNVESRKRGLHAATLLAGRFNPVGKFIRAWNNNKHRDTTGWVIIDSMCNLPLLYWASDELNDPRFNHIAQMHANTVADNFIRENGSCAHIIEFDPYSGKQICSYGGQGYAAGSSWTRGQSWGIYGFILSYLHTKDEKYLNLAQQIADFFLSRIPESGLIPIDFDQPSDSTLEDSTAGAIASCGLIELAKNVDSPEKERYQTAAIEILKKLIEARCDLSKDSDGILTHCSGSYHAQESHHTSLIYADYYLLEALLKLKGSEFLIW